MTTTSVPIDITCPDWCVVSAEEHAADLWNQGGVCIHHSQVVDVADPVGFLEPLSDPKFCKPVSLSFSTTTQPEGCETTSPLFFINDQEMTAAQALAFADIIRTLVVTYRDSGGTS